MVAGSFNRQEIVELLDGIKRDSGIQQIAATLKYAISPKLQEKNIR